MRTLKLKHDTFIRTFGVRTLKDQLSYQGQAPIHYVQPNDGILKDYDCVEVSSMNMVGMDDWGRTLIEIITTFTVQKYDDLSLQLVVEKVMVPGVEKSLSE